MLRWYAALAILSRGATTLGLIAVSFVVEQVEYGIIGLAFVGITTASQVFGYPGYLTALNSSKAEPCDKTRRIPLAILLALAAFVFVFAFLWPQLGGEHVLLLMVSALAAAALSASTTLNGILQKLKYERFAAQNMGAFLVPAIVIGVLSSHWLSFGSLIAAIFLAHLMAVAAALRYSRSHNVKLGSLPLMYMDYALFALSGLAASLLLVLAANMLFSRGGAAEMGQLTLALQLRAVLIFGAGIVGAEMLSRYSSIAKSDNQFKFNQVFSDFVGILKGLCLPVLAGFAAISIVDIESYQPLFNRNAVYFMLLSGVLVCASVPFSRAITAQYSEYWNVAVAVASLIVSGTGFFVVSSDADSFAFIFAFNSFITLILTIVALVYLVRSRGGLG